MIAIDIPKYEYHTGPRSRQMAYALDMVYGSTNYKTFDGQTKNGPAIAAVGAFSAISAGVTIGGFLGGVIIAGGVLGMVGAVTGNKTLMAIGTIAGLAGGFVTPEGAFNNPFTDGFANSATSKAFSNVFDGIKSSLGIDPGTGSKIATDITTQAGGNGALVNAAKAGALNVNGATAIGKGAEIAASAAPVAKSGIGASGLLSAASGTKDILGLVSGAAEGYQNQPLIDSQIDRLDAQTDATKQQIDLTNSRINNKQFQDTGNIAQSNSDAQLYNTNPSAQTQGKFAVVVGNEVKYVTAQEYEQLRAAQAQQPTGGLINQAGGA